MVQTLDTDSIHSTKLRLELLSLHPRNLVTFTRNILLLLVSTTLLNMFSHINSQRQHEFSQTKKRMTGKTCSGEPTNVILTLGFRCRERHCCYS